MTYISKYSVPDTNGYFNGFGGQIVPDFLKPVMREIAEAYEKIKVDPEFIREMKLRIG